MMISCSRRDSTLPETNSSHLKMDGWNTSSFPFWDPSLFSGAFAVSFWEILHGRVNEFLPMR